MGRAIDKQTMLGLIIDAKRTDPETGSFAEWLAEYLAEHMPTLTPPNEPLTLDKKRMIAKSCLHYSKSGSCTLRGYAPLDCPRCKEWQSNESNEPLTLEELREMDEPVWVACKPIEGGNGYWCLCQHGHIITPAGSIYDVKEIPHWVFYRRPLEGAEDGNV